MMRVFLLLLGVAVALGVLWTSVLTAPPPQDYDERLLVDAGHWLAGRGSVAVEVDLVTTGEQLEQPVNATVYLISTTTPRFQGQFVFTEHAERWLWNGKTVFQVDAGGAEAYPIEDPQRLEETFFDSALSLKEMFWGVQWSDYQVLRVRKERDGQTTMTLAAKTASRPYVRVDVRIDDQGTVHSWKGYDNANVLLKTWVVDALEDYGDQRVPTQITVTDVQHKRQTVISTHPRRSHGMPQAFFTAQTLASMHVSE